MNRMKGTFGVAAMLATFAATPLVAQTQTTQEDAGLGATRNAAQYLKTMLTAAAEQMSEEDYAFKPTPEVRSFGQILAHIADQDYGFCAAAKGEKVTSNRYEKTRSTKAEIQKALLDTFAYCDAVYAGMTSARANTMVEFGKRQMPAVTVLIYRTHHATLHYGNVITYMRLRGKVPPSTAMLSD